MATHLPEVGADVADVDMSGQTVLVTGSTSGIGREAALAFGRLGAEVLVHGRDEERGRAVVAELDGTDADAAAFFAADFADLSAVRGLAEDVAEYADELDVLANNAGGYFPNGGTTEDGIAFTFGVNHLAPFLLSAELLPTLADDGRVVTTSSLAHRQGSMDFESLRTAETGQGWGEYAQSKLANILFTRELARRLDAAGRDVTANCFHPGAIPESGFVRNAPFPIPMASRALSMVPDPLVRPFVTTVSEGAETLVYLGAAVADTSGGYFTNCRQRRPSREARDDETARPLWEVSEDLAGAEYELVPVAQR